MSPEEFAGLLFGAIEADQLYLLTHPEIKERVRNRMEDIIQERNPTPEAPG